MDKRYLCGLTAKEITDLIKPGGYTRNQAIIVAGIFYRKGESGLIRTTRIPVMLKKFLFEAASSGVYSPVKSEKSADGTIKYLFTSPDGKKYESVYIPEEKRKTICVSTQSGCKMGCPFCATGRYGFHGNLSAGDIINQVLANPFHDKITHVVFMGMGEPLDNLDNVLKAISILSAEWGMAISNRNITVSTVGITAMVKRFLQESECNLALSLYSPFPGERINVIPVEKTFPAREIISMMAYYPLRKKRRLSIAYIMIKNINDTDNHLDELKNILINTGIRVNLMPYHAVQGDTRESSSDERMQYFRHNLMMSGISASVRKSRGADISAACGLLASEIR